MELGTGFSAALLGPEVDVGLVCDQRDAVHPNLLRQLARGGASVNESSTVYGNLATWLWLSNMGQPQNGLICKCIRD